MKSNQIVSVGYDEAGNVMTFTAIGGGTARLEVSALAEKIRHTATIHGLAQKVRDAAAIARSTATGQPATPKEKLNAMQGVIDNLLAGRWNAERKGGGRIGADETLLSRAMAEVYKQKNPDEIRAKVAAMTREERTALLNVPKIKEVADRMRAETVKDVDVSALLEDFE